MCICSAVPVKQCVGHTRQNGWSASDRGFKEMPAGATFAIPLILFSNFKITNYFNRVFQDYDAKGLTK